MKGFTNGQRQNSQCFTLKENGSWTQGPNLTNSIGAGAAISTNEKILIFGGPSQIEDKSAIHEINSNRSTEIGHLPFKFDRGCAINQNGSVHIIGGWQNFHMSNHTWISPIENFDWKRGQDLIQGRIDHACAFIPKWDIGIVTGGYFYAAIALSSTELLRNGRFSTGWS